jgi:hypothetical protein
MLEDSGGVADGKAARRRCARESPKGFLHHQLDMCSLGVACLTLPAALHPDPVVPNAQPCVLAMDPDGGPPPSTTAPKWGSPQSIYCSVWSGDGDVLVVREKGECCVVGREGNERISLTWSSLTWKEEWARCLIFYHRSNVLLIALLLQIYNKSSWPVLSASPHLFIPLLSRHDSPPILSKNTKFGV